MRAIILFFFYYGSVAYTIINPTYGLLFFIHITIFRPESLVWGNVIFGRLHLITALTVLISYIVQNFIKSDNHKLGVYQKVNLWLLFCFSLWLIIISLLAEFSVQISLNKAFDFIKIFIICLLFANLINTEFKIQAYIWVVTLSFGLLGFWGALQGFAGNPRLDTLWPGGSNFAAAQFALFAPLALTKSFDPNLPIKYKIVFIFCFVSMVICCIYTDSRGGILGVLIGISICISYVKNRIKILVAIITMSLIFSPLIPSHYTERIASIFAEKENRDESASSRFVLWGIALRIWSDHPVAGVGLENFSPVKEAYADKFSDLISEDMFLLIFNRPRYPHGLYPGMMAETGIVGLLLFLMLLSRNILCRFPDQFVRNENHYPLYQQAWGARAGLVGFSVSAIFGDFQYIETFYFHLFFVGAVREYADSAVRDIGKDIHGYKLKIQ